MTATVPGTRLDFTLPDELAARQPPEATPGAGRSDVRLMLSDGERVPTHHDFPELPALLRPGDLLVVNTSATIPAAIDGRSAAGDALVVHLSTDLPTGLWLVEVRCPDGRGTSRPDPTDRSSTAISIEGGGIVRLHTRLDGSERLWVASVEVPSSDVRHHLHRHGRPIRYSYVEQDWPIDAYRTVFARVPGSAEMPSASRPFTGATLADLATRGVSIAPVTLHTGVSSLEAHEAPYPERYDVPAATARLVNHTRSVGGRVIAVGTTVVRALESVVDDQRLVHPGRG